MTKAPSVADRRKALQARHALATITPRQVAAMHALDARTLSDLTATVAEVVAAVRTPRADDVESYAMTIAADIYAGAGDVRKAARKAVKVARTRVAAAYALDESLDAWEGEVEDALEDVERAPGRLHSHAPDPYDVVAPSSLDTVAAAVWSGIGNGLDVRDAWEWSRAVVAYLDHLTGARACPVCEGRPATKRPTFWTVLAHVEGRSGSGKAGQAHRAALGRVAAYLVACGARADVEYRTAPGKASRVRLGHDVADYATGTLAASVTDGTGNVRALSPVEAWAVARVDAWAVPVDWEAVRADRATSHDVGNRRNVDGTLATGARPAPRRRGHSSGQTGSTIPATF